MRTFLFVTAIIVCSVSLAGNALAQPTTVSYQGELLRNGVRWDGPAEFKFAILSAGSYIWSHDGTLGEPGATMTITVGNGIFNVQLGAPPMPPLTSTLLQGVTDAMLRVWVDTGDGLEQMSNQPFSSSAFALAAEASAVGMDDDWIIDGDDVHHVTGRVGIGTDSPQTRLHVAGRIYISKGNNSSEIQLDNNSDVTTAVISGQSNGGGRINLFDGTAPDATIVLDANNGGESRVLLRDPSGQLTVQIEGEDTDAPAGGGRINLLNGLTGTATIVLDSREGGGSKIKLRDTVGEDTIVIDSEDALGTGGEILMYNGAGARAIELDASWLGGPSRIIVDVLEINGGADLSENFNVRNGDHSVKPGTVVTIDPDVQGGLAVCDRAYDRRVAGIVSGAGGVRPGMLMGQNDTLANGAHPVALTGRVYCWADASHGGISPGDLLTTSKTPGHAQKVTDRDRASGAILGKAMTTLERGKGLVLVLVSLQ